jgi:hypothetical protein
MLILSIGNSDVSQALYLVSHGSGLSESVPVNNYLAADGLCSVNFTLPGQNLSQPTLAQQQPSLITKGAVVLNDWQCIPSGFLKFAMQKGPC